MQYRKLRIAWSFGCGTLAVILSVLWIKSYLERTSYAVLVTPTNRYYVHSRRGAVAIEREVRVFITVELMRIYEESDYLHLTTNAGVRILRDNPDGSVYAASFSYWLLDVAALFGIVLPWIPSRFSLRTLLIAITIVAVGLGVAVMRFRGS